MKYGIWVMMALVFGSGCIQTRTGSSGACGIGGYGTQESCVMSNPGQNCMMTTVQPDPMSKASICWVPQMSFSTTTTGGTSTTGSTTGATPTPTVSQAQTLYNSYPPQEACIDCGNMGSTTYERKDANFNICQKTVTTNLNLTTTHVCYQYLSGVNANWMYQNATVNAVPHTRTPYGGTTPLTSYSEKDFIYNGVPARCRLVGTYSYCYQKVP